MSESPKNNPASQPDSNPPAGFASTKNREVTVAVRGLNHYFDDGELRKQVLFENNLDLHGGEIVIMTGPSGSGKTTLLTLIGALRTVQEGSLKILGQELRGLSANQLVQLRRGIGFIFQAHNLFGSLTAIQNVRMSMELTDISPKEMEERGKEMLTRLGLGHRIDYKPSALSGGQRQRVAIARALANHPKLILADEPTAALDKASGRDVVNLMRQFAEENGSTILMVTHDNRILDAADRIVNMVDGSIISDVLVVESEVICEFLGKSPVFEHLTPGTLAQVADQMRFESHPPGTAIVRQGDPGDSFYLIREGEVDVEIETAEEKQTVAHLGSGDYFGEAALLTGEPRNATVRATTDLELYALDNEQFQAVVQSSASFAEELRNALFQRH